MCKCIVCGKENYPVLRNFPKPSVPINVTKSGRSSTKPQIVNV